MVAPDVPPPGRTPLAGMPPPAGRWAGWHWVLHQVLGGGTAAAGGVLLFTAHHGPGGLGPAAIDMYAFSLVLLVGGTLWFACGWILHGR